MPEAPSFTPEFSQAGLDLEQVLPLQQARSLIQGINRFRSCSPQDPGTIFTRDSDETFRAKFFMDHGFGAGTSASPFETFLDSLSGLNYIGIGWTGKKDDVRPGLYYKCQTLFNRIFQNSLPLDKETREPSISAFLYRHDLYQGNSLALVKIPQENVIILFVLAVEMGGFGGTGRSMPTAIIIETHQQQFDEFDNFFRQYGPLGINALSELLFSQEITPYEETTGTDTSRFTAFIRSPMVIGTQQKPFRILTATISIEELEASRT